MFDAIVVGARCAGSPTAMLLAQRGHRVLLVDKATFPSDTLSTHLVHLPGVAALERWGLLDGLRATDCPAMSHYSYDFGAFTLAGTPAPANGIGMAFAPRRTILDALLLEGAAKAGAEVREAFAVTELLFDDDRVIGVRGRSAHGTTVEERARCVIGADGRHSTVAKIVQPQEYAARPPLGVGYYSYYSGLPTEGVRYFIRPGRAFGAFPTHDGLALVFAAWPYAEFESNRHDVEGSFARTLELEPEFAGRVRAAHREGPFRGAPVANYVRKPFGAGWALVGDAAYNKDPCTAFGISDAFADAERCASALHEGLAGVRPFQDAMDDYQRNRDVHVLPAYAFTCSLATLEPPPPDVRRRLAWSHGDPTAEERFVSMMAGTLPVPAFFGAGG